MRIPRVVQPMDGSSPGKTGHRCQGLRKVLDGQSQWISTEQGCLVQSPVFVMRPLASLNAVDLASFRQRPKCH
jgi:hypothetical protein